MDRSSLLQFLFETARNMMKVALGARLKERPKGFEKFADDAIALLYDMRKEADPFYASVSGDVIARLFAIDVCTGYNFFHSDDIIKKIWAIYDSASAQLVPLVDIQRKFRTEPPYKVACLATAFSDFLAPCKALANFAMSLDRSLFEPIIIVTDQVATMKRSSNKLKPYHQTDTGKKLLAQKIDILSVPPCKDMAELSIMLMDICKQHEIDITVTNGSLFCFPETCVACSDATGSFFDLHRGFPMYSSGIDAILHWVTATREVQCGPWLEAGRKVIDFRDGIAVPDLPDKMPEKSPSTVRLVTASNHLVDRFIPEFCSMVDRIMLKYPQTQYYVIGESYGEDILTKFDPAIRDRINLLGPINGFEKMYETLLECDIYLNEFPVSGVRICLEAMCACLPIITMKCGDLHVNATAAEHVGDFAIQENDPEKYFTLVEEMITDRDKRLNIGKSLRNRMETLYDYKKNFDKLSREMLAIHEEKIAAMQ